MEIMTSIAILLSGVLVGCSISNLLLSTLVNKIIVIALNEYNGQIQKVFESWKKEELSNVVDYLSKSNELQFDINQKKKELEALNKKAGEING